MKIIDKNGRLFGKISIIDVVVVLVVAVMALGLYVKSNTKTITASTEDEIITYQVMVNAIPDYMAEALKVDDQVFEDGVYGDSLGKVTDIEISDGDRLAGLPNGTLEMIPVDGTVNMLVTIEGRGIVDEGNYMLNRIYNLGINSARTFCTPYTQFTGTVINIEK